MQEYRVLQFNENDKTIYRIHRVTFDEQGRAVSYEKQPAYSDGDTIENLSYNVIHLTSALTKPIIDAKIIEDLKIDEDAMKKYKELMSMTKHV
tara:strand:- start:11 stop:289 length:279 start_codon:yes stop_codon:yes gene_type:complete